MSNDRESMNGDDRVSAAYRELATERSPDTLDHRILAEARRGAATRYAMLRGWTRPVAWAAMIAMSLAIVLHVSQTPEMQTLPLEEANGTATRGEPEANRSALESRDDGAGAGKPAAPATAQQPADSRHTRAETPASQKLMLAPAASKLAPPETGNDSAERLSAAAFASEPGEEPICPATSRLTPEDWLACIDALRNGGDIEAAALEFERFRDAFPDFPVETPHK